MSGPIPANPVVRVAFQDLIDLISSKVGGRALLTNDEFFAEKENLLKPEPAVFIVEDYTDRGKWMDGWESRRKRVPGYDWCILKLGLPGVIRGFNVDTSFFTGNFPDRCSIEGCEAAGDPSGAELEKAAWVTILPESRLQGNAHNLFPVHNDKRFTHLRLNIFPDGGIARLRVHGEVKPDWKAVVSSGEKIDLAAAANGAVVVNTSDAFFGPKDNLIMPGRAAHMGEGWETKRRRGPGFDWLILKMAATGTVEKIEIDTNHFKGNYPDTCMIEAGVMNSAGEIAWTEILARTKLQAHHQHYFESELKRVAGATHLRVNIYPDGGISRLRCWGTPDPNSHA